MARKLEFVFTNTAVLDISSTGECLIYKYFDSCSDFYGAIFSENENFQIYSLTERYNPEIYIIDSLYLANSNNRNRKLYVTYALSFGWISSMLSKKHSLNIIGANKIFDFVLGEKVDGYIVFPFIYTYFTDFGTSSSTLEVKLAVTETTSIKGILPPLIYPKLDIYIENLKNIDVPLPIYRYSYIKNEYGDIQVQNRSPGNPLTNWIEVIHNNPATSYVKLTSFLPIYLEIPPLMVTNDYLNCYDLAFVWGIPYNKAVTTFKTLLENPANINIEVPKEHLYPETKTNISGLHKSILYWDIEFDKNYNRIVYYFNLHLTANDKFKTFDYKSCFTPGVFDKPGKWYLRNYAPTVEIYYQIEMENVGDLRRKLITAIALYKQLYNFLKELITGGKKIPAVLIGSDKITFKGITEDTPKNQADMEYTPYNIYINSKIIETEGWHIFPKGGKTFVNPKNSKAKYIGFINLSSTPLSIIVNFSAQVEEIYLPLDANIQTSINLKPGQKVHFFIMEDISLFGDTANAYPPSNAHVLTVELLEGQATVIVNGEGNVKIQGTSDSVLKTLIEYPVMYNRPVTINILGFRKVESRLVSTHYLPEDLEKRNYLVLPKIYSPNVTFIFSEPLPLYFETERIWKHGALYPYLKDKFPGIFAKLLMEKFRYHEDGLDTPVDLPKGLLTYMAPRSNIEIITK